MFHKVLILSASGGAGHIRAAQALEKAFAIAATAGEVKHVDVLKYTSSTFRWFCADFYLWQVNRAPHLWGVLYDAMDKQWDRGFSQLMMHAHARRLVKMIRKYRPDLIICTHFFPADIVSWQRDRGLLSIPQSIVVTDIDAHAAWMCRNYESYFVASEETRQHLGRVGIDRDRIVVTGIPIDPVFAEPKDKEQMRAKLGLKQKLDTILLSSGGTGLESMERQLGYLMELNHPAQIVVLCGRNELLKARVDCMAQETADDRLTIHPVGFTERIDEYMAAADVLVGKAGGLTTAEALARGLAMVIVNPTPGQEARNADHLLEAGAAVRCNNLPVLSYKIDLMLEDSLRLKSMQANARRLGRPRAALDVVQRLSSDQRLLMGQRLPA